MGIGRAPRLLRRIEGPRVRRRDVISSDARRR